MNKNLHVNKTNFHMKGFALGLTLKQAKGNLEIAYCFPHLKNHSPVSLTILLGDQVFGVFILVTGCKQEQGSG